MSKSKRIAKRIRTIRKRLGLTQEQLSVKLGLTREAITQWENGRAIPGGPAMILLEQLEAEADQAVKREAKTPAKGQ